MSQASYIVLATVAGGLYFQEFAAMEWWQLLVFACCIGVMFVGLALLMPPITGASAPELNAPEEEGGGVKEESISRKSRQSASTPGSRRITLARSVSFTNHPSYRASVAARSSERRPSQVAAGIHDIYGGAGAGVAVSSASFSGRRPTLKEALGAARRASARSDTNLAESTDITIQMPSLGEVSERETFASPSEFSMKQSQKEFRRIAGARESSAISPPATVMPPMTPPSVAATPSV